MIIFNKEEELADYIGREVGPSRWLQIDQKRIKLFAEATGDQQWIHTDAEKAKEGPFGSTIVHGFLLLSVLPVLKAELVSFRFAQMAINYGSDKVRYLKPVKVDSEIRLNIRLEKIEKTSSGTKVYTVSYLEIRGEAGPAMVAHSITLLVGGTPEVL